MLSVFLLLILNEKKTLIIGAGLSGLLTAYRLKNKGFIVEIVESRDRLGGRIHTLNSDFATLEMGATWFNDVHGNVKRILNEFNLPHFEQFMKGTSYFEPFSQAPAQEIEIPQNSPSYRFVGGTSQLIEAIKSNLHEVKFNFDEVVSEIDFSNDKVMVKTNNYTYEADYVISTIPPALLVNEVIFKPNLPETLSKIAKETHTWMQDSIKVALVYRNPFWRENEISGTVFSNVGPVTEFYDHSNFELDQFALCGFVSSGMSMFSKEERLNKILIQLKKIFGKEVLNFIDYQETVWSEEAFTKSKKQESLVFPHQNNGHTLFRENHFENRLFISGSETATNFPGYMEGAILAAEHVAQIIGITND